MRHVARSHTAGVGTGGDACGADVCFGSDGFDGRIARSVWHDAGRERAFVLAQMALVQARIDELEAKIERWGRELAKRDKFLRVDPQGGSAEEPKSPAAPGQPSKRTRGGQPGHLRFERALVPVEQCQEGSRSNSVRKSLPADRRCVAVVARSSAGPIRPRCVTQ